MSNRSSRNPKKLSALTATDASLVHYLEFDIDRISDAIVRATSVTLDAVKKYERAKDVPQRVLEAEVCI